MKRLFEASINFYESLPLYLPTENIGRIEKKYGFHPDWREISGKHSSAYLDGTMIIVMNLGKAHNKSIFEVELHEYGHFLQIAKNMDKEMLRNLYNYYKTFPKYMKDWVIVDDNHIYMKHSPPDRIGYKEMWADLFATYELGLLKKDNEQAVEILLR